jgi:hypothetical protein
MIQRPQYLFWIGATLLAAYVAALGWRLGVARRFPFQTAYLVLSLGAELSRWLIFERWGFTAELWMNFYYGSDLLLAVALYFVIVELQRRLLPAQPWRLLHRCSLAMGQMQEVDVRLHPAPRAVKRWDLGFSAGRSFHTM